ncbi:MAG: HRDC domain-containing protein, partial [Saprospiraceae bacterium]
PIPGGEDMNDEMNKFLRSKKVLQTENHLVSNGNETFWCFCIKYLDEAPQGKRQKVDYRQVLDEESFQRFAHMRQIRKQLAQEEGIPAYAIFTDEELAGLAQLEVRTPATMRSVKGIGEKKVEKYGEHFFTKKEPE